MEIGIGCGVDDKYFGLPNNDIDVLYETGEYGKNHENKLIINNTTDMRTISIQIHRQESLEYPCLRLMFFIKKQQFFVQLILK